ncbi:trimeric intracellular cation channel family protein [Microbacterium sp. SSW1-59]|uniref:trimeric intracellular cation channel family protein n=1 Tax=Microbacterium xanthum TaxID=3079794 RepID=UPI002AD50B2A|nr:trimeric intracellular cation channel family protein [Microbacterium sp. SSW1-59]MDZ8200381.1 trimeric intracellular cation channel family protein [Microbacterium sp. SSW1-59]
MTVDGDPISSALGVIQVMMEYTGSVAFAISGAVAAGRKKMDLVGVVVLACIVAVGGGTMRDLLLGELPVFWVDNPTFLLVGAVTALIVVPLTRTRALDLLHRYQIVQVSDAAGMALFVVVGTNVAIAAGADSVAAAIIGVISGVGGGIIRDVLANDVPDVFRSGQFYATAALIGAGVYVILLEFDLDEAVVFWVPIVIILAIRLGTLFLGWGVPTFRYGAPPTEPIPTAPPRPDGTD